MTREGLIGFVRDFNSKLLAGKMTEQEEAHGIEVLEKNVPHPGISDLIYWPPDNKDLTPEEIIDIALSYDWKANQKIVCSQVMKELLEKAEYEPREDDSLVSGFFDDPNRFDVRTCREMPENEKMSDAAKNNTVCLDGYDRIEDMLIVVENFERYLKKLYPNGYFQSYFILKDNEKPMLTFHHHSPNGDWIRDEKAEKMSYPIRKNTF